jgi:hypothetical protein
LNDVCMIKTMKNKQKEWHPAITVETKHIFNSPSMNVITDFKTTR